jgi:hypothetical protein
VQRISEPLDDAEAARVEQWLADVVLRRARAANEDAISIAR